MKLAVKQTGSLGGQDREILLDAIDARAELHFEGAKLMAEETSNPTAQARVGNLFDRIGLEPE
jgi:hypothetical protein